MNANKRKFKQYVDFICVYSRSFADGIRTASLEIPAPQAQNIDIPLSRRRRFSTVTQQN